MITPLCIDQTPTDKMVSGMRNKVTVAMFRQRIVTIVLKGHQ